MKASIFIPSIPEHWGNVTQIIDHYCRGTVRPDEIVVFLSNSQQVKPEHRAAVKHHHSKLVRLITAQQKVYAGPARQQALIQCQGDIVLYQDSDDLPHAKRVEFVKRLFETRDCEIVNHSYFWRSQPDYEFTWEDMHVVQGETLWPIYFPHANIKECRKYSDAYGGGAGFAVHAGAACVRRHILEKVKWKAPDQLQYAPEPLTKTEDYEFCMDMLFYVNKSIIVDAPLYYYR